MQKKILLKKTREYLQNSFPENLFPAKKLRQNKKKLFVHKTRNLKTQIIKAKKEVFNQYANSTKKLFALKHNLVLNKNIFFYNPKVGTTNFPSNEFGLSQSFTDKTNANSTFSYKNKFNFSVQKTFIENKQTSFVERSPPFLFSTNQIQYELSRKKTRSSDFKNQLKERKKLALIYGHLSKKYITKILKQAAKLNGKKHDNFFFLLEARLDVVLFRACFFSSIKSARQWINHNKILVNNQVINTSSYTMKPGDIISIKQKNKLLLCKQIKHFLKKSFFKQNKMPSNQFIISMFLFKKLQSLLNPLKVFSAKSQKGTNQPLISHFKQNPVERNYQALLDTLITTKMSSAPAKGLAPKGKGSQPKVDYQGGKPVKNNFITNKVCNKITSEVYTNSILHYKQFLFQVKQVLRSVINNYSKKNRSFKMTNSFALNLSQAEKNTLLSNLIELEFLEKENLDFAPAKGKKKSLENLRGFLIHLKLKKLFFKSEKNKKSFTILNQNVLKPLNLEISYKNLMIIFLYSPQKIPFSCSIDMELLSRSLA